MMKRFGHAGRIAAAAAAFLLLGLRGAEAVECRLSPDGSVTTWLLSPAFPLEDQSDFTKDFLPKDMGETSGFRHAEGAGPVKWQGHAFNSAVVTLSAYCRERGDSVIYAACELRARETATYEVFATIGANGAIWLDGKPVLEPAADNRPHVQKPVKLNLEKGKSHQLLLKVVSRGAAALFNLSFIKLGAERTPVPVDVMLHVPKQREGALLAESLAFGGLGSGIVRAGQRLALELRAPAGYPVLGAEAKVQVRILDHAGGDAKVFEPQALRATGAPAVGAALAWLVPDGTKEPTYTARADVLIGEAQVGRQSGVFYTAEGVSGWLRKLGSRLADVELQLGPRQRYINPDIALARLRIEKAQLFALRQGDPADIAKRVVGELTGCDRAITRLEGQKRQPVGVPGLSERAYFSTVDDTPQPYYVYVPKQHDGVRHLSVIVYLHGYSPDLDKLNWEMIPRRLLDHCDKYGFYLVVPFARSNTDFQGIGEADILTVFQLFAQRHPIDADRVFLFGYSMGGMGAFTVGGHYPDLWAGIVAVSSRADYYLWQNLDRDKVEPYKRHLIDTEFGAEMAGNFRNLPVLMFHGGEDSLVKVEQPRRLEAKLRAAGCDVTLRGLPGKDHWIMSDVLRDDAAFKWMAARRRAARPAAVDFTTRTIKYRRAYWVTVLELAQWGRPVRVRATFNKDRTALDVRTENVASLRLDLPKELVGEKPRLLVKINGKEQTVSAPGPVTFDVEPMKHVGKLRKTPRLCGPVKEAYGSRFTIVVGTGAGERADIQRFNGERQRAAVEWYLFTKSLPAVKADVQVTEQDIRDSNLILYGTPSENSVLRKIADKLPIRITDGGFKFRGQAYSNATHGLVMAYPNPLNPSRLVVVRSGLPHGARLSPNHKLDLLPDFVVFREGVDYDKTNEAVVAGFFDRDWQVAERLIWRRGKERPDPRLPAEDDGAMPATRGGATKPPATSGGATKPGHAADAGTPSSSN